MTAKKATEPEFNFGPDSTAATSNARRLEYTPELTSKSHTRASEIMLYISKHPEIHELANRALDDVNGKTTDLIKLVETVIDDEKLTADAEFLAGADDDILDRLLKSRQSDRSKTRDKGIRSSVMNCTKFIADMYAEMVVRKAWNKPYDENRSNIEINGEDQDAISRKVKSLQSKKSRLSKLAAYDAAAAAELSETETEIARLNALRPNARVNGKVVVKGPDVKVLRAKLNELDLSSMSEEDQAKVKELMAAIG